MVTGQMGDVRLGQLAEVTGLTPELIRAWERRYGFPIPLRTQGGHRRYTAEQAETLRQAHLLTRAGMRAREALQRAQQAATAPAELGADTAVDDLAGLLSEAEPRAAGILRGLEVTLGFENALEHRVLPALRQVGEGWAAARVSVAQEHAATGIVLAWLGAARFATRPEQEPEALIACPAGEEHAVGCWALDVLLSRRGVASLALGANVPDDSLAGEIVRRAPRAVVLAAYRRPRSSTLRAAAEAAGQVSECRVYCGGPGAPARPARGIHVLRTSLKEAADRIAADLAASG